MNDKTFASALCLIQSGGPGHIKRGLQDVCNAIEIGAGLTQHQRLTVIVEVARLKGAADAKVRRWLYKLIGLLRHDGYVSYMIGQLVGGETDEENLTWLCAALFATVAEPMAMKHFRRSGREFYGTPFELAAHYFRGRTRAADQDDVASATRSDSDLGYQWISLLSGQHQLHAPRQVVFDLNRHPTPIVAEYSLWAAHRDETARLADLHVYPHEVTRMPPSVRRWYYRVLTKAVADIAPNVDLVQQAIVDSSEEAREGLALGLRELAIDSESAVVVSILAPFVADWYEQEESEHVRRSLQTHAEQFPFAYGRYRDLLAQEDRELTGLALPSGTRPVFLVPQQLKLPITKERKHMATPRVENAVQRETYLLALDTVDFSKQPNDRQYMIFRDLLEVLAANNTLQQTDPNDVVTLLTGDGLILAWGQPENRHAPLRVAQDIQEIYADLRKYEVRLGVNSGMVFWIELQDGSRQLIGFAVNWTVRVMSAAAGGAILVSRHYHEGIVHPDINRFRGVTFSSVLGLVTKHGEAIEALEARWNDQ